MFHDRIGIDDDVVRLSSVDQRLERTNLRSVRISTHCEPLEELTNVLSIFTASLELGSIVRGRDLVFLSSTINSHIENAEPYHSNIGKL